MILLNNNMKKTSIIVASLILIPILSSDAYPQIRGRVRRDIGNAVGEAVGEAAAEGGANAISEILSSIFGPEDPVKAYQHKRDCEAEVFSNIIKYNNQNPSEGGNLVRNIVEDSMKYRNSLSKEGLERFDAFYKKIDEEKDGRHNLVKKNSAFFPWRLFPDRLDIAELHLLYQIKTMEDEIDAADKEKDYKKYGILGSKLHDFKSTLYRPVISPAPLPKVR
jgi:hypothetical protein